MTGRPLDPIVRDASGRSHGRKGNRGVRYRPVLTANHLRALKACDHSIARFIAAYPSGALVDGDTARAADAAGFDLLGLACLLGVQTAKQGRECYCGQCIARDPELFNQLATHVRLWIARYNQGLV